MCIVVEVLLQFTRQHPRHVQWLSDVKGADAVIKRTLLLKNTQTSLFMCEIVSLILSTGSAGPLKALLLKSEFFGKSVLCCHE